MAIITVETNDGQVTEVIHITQLLPYVGRLVSGTQRALELEP